MLRIIIVDDEHNVLDGMKYLFNKYMPQHRIVATLQNPGDIFPILEQEQIDLVFTDVKMPEITGIELTARIIDKYPATVVVVLSAYQDFDYVRQCLKNGAYDYLLKPASCESIEDVTKKIELMISTRKEAEGHILESSNIQSALTKKRELPEPWNQHGTLQMYVCLPCPDENGDSGNSAMLINLYENCLYEVSHPFFIDGYMIALSQLIRPHSEAKELLDKCVAHFRNIEYQAYCTYITFPNNSGAVLKAVERCRKAIDFTVFNNISSVITEDEYKKYTLNLPNVLVSDYISGKKIVNLISTREAQAVDSYMNEGFNKILSGSRFIKPEKLRLDLIKELFILANEYKNLDITVLEDIIMPALFPRSRELVPKWFCEYILKIAELTIAINLPDYVHQAIEYINSNYMRNITLKKTAESIHINQWYLSTQFKKTMAVGFTEYLNKVRVGYAKKLLEEKGLKIYQVAELVGFNEPTYFNTVFKKIEGISPKEYQLRLQFGDQG